MPINFNLLDGVGNNNNDERLAALEDEVRDLRSNSNIDRIVRGESVAVWTWGPVYYDEAVHPANLDWPFLVPANVIQLSLATLTVTPVIGSDISVWVNGTLLTPSAFDAETTFDITERLRDSGGRIVIGNHDIEFDIATGESGKRLMATGHCVATVRPTSSLHNAGSANSDPIPPGGQGSGTRG